MKIALLDIVFCSFPTEEGTNLLHYGLVSGLEQRVSGVWYAHIVYATSKKVDQNCNNAQKSIDFVVTTTNFGRNFWNKTGLTLKPGMTGARFQCNKTAWIPVAELKRVGLLDIKDQPAAFNALRNAILNANY